MLAFGENNPRNHKYEKWGLDLTISWFVRNLFSGDDGCRYRDGYWQEFANQWTFNSGCKT